MRFGNWTGSGAAAPAKNFDAAVPEGEGKIVVIHRANSPQSMILAGQVLPYKGRTTLLKLNAANEILGGNFLSRINMDLRETKGWSYGTRNSVLRGEDRVLYTMRAPVQTNQTGPAVAAIDAQVREFSRRKWRDASGTGTYGQRQCSPVARPVRAHDQRPRTRCRVT